MKEYKIEDFYKFRKQVKIALLIIFIIALIGVFT